LEWWFIIDDTSGNVNQTKI